MCKRGDVGEAEEKGWDKEWEEDEEQDERLKVVCGGKFPECHCGPDSSPRKLNIDQSHRPANNEGDKEEY